MLSRLRPGRYAQHLLAATGLVTLLSGTASAQIEDTWLEQVDPWGVSYVGEDEPVFRTRMWRGADSEDLLTVVQSARTTGLTPAEHMLMRRLALSPARAPSGEESGALLAARARIAFELGEAAAAAGQFSRLTEPSDGFDAAAMAADLNLALGNEASACESLGAPDLEGDYWARLRAVCAALAGNTSGAELAMEMAQAQGVKDNWLAGAVYAASGVTPNPPKARFDTGIGFAMSTRANLEVTPDSVPEDRPDLAAAMARRKLIPPAVRVKAAGLAARAYLITPEEYRTAYNSALSADGFTPTSALDKAIFVASDGLTSAEEKSKALAAALKAAAGQADRYSAVASLLVADIARLPLGPDTEADAPLFARAALAAGNTAEVIRWITPPEPEVVPVELPAEPTEEAPAELPLDVVAEAPAEDVPEEAPVEELPPPEPVLPSFDQAWLGALVMLAEDETDPEAVAASARMLIQVAESDAEKQAAARVFALWAAAGIAPPSDARAYLANESDTSPKSSDIGPALAVLGAARSGTAAEVVVQTLGLTDGDPSKLDLASLTILLGALEAVGAEDAARLLALESTGYWKAQK
ncbi:MAG TPA: hypothetical protein PK417_09280 [Hyphomonas sp.]|nr:hypothetical protein [Hyphomonas sp.]